MKYIRQTVCLTALAFMVAGCVLYRKPRPIDFHTNYQPDAIYVLQEDVALVDTRVTWSTINRPRYWASMRHLYDKRNLVLPKGSRIQFKKIRYEYNPEIGRISTPLGIILDPPAEGKTVNLHHISQERENEVTSDLRVTYGRYINPLILRKE